MLGVGELGAYSQGSALDHPDFHDGGAYFTMSGTSQAAAVVSEEVRSGS